MKPFAAPQRPQTFLVTSADASIAARMRPGLHSLRSMGQRDGMNKMEISVEETERRISYALALGYPSLAILRDIAPPGSRVMIIGGGPSIKSLLPRIRDQVAKGVKICAVNISHDWLFDNGVKPDFSVMLDPAPRVAGYQKPRPGVVYIIGTTVHYSVWRKFREAGVRPFVFVPVVHDKQHETIMARYPHANPFFVGGWTTVGLRAVNLMRHLGFQDIELDGFDSCCAPQTETERPKLYAYDKPHIHEDLREATLVSYSTKRKFIFRTNGAMYRQIKSYCSMISQLEDSETNGRLGGVKIYVSGDGAIPWMAWIDGGKDKCVEHTDPEAMLAKYGPIGDWDYHRNRAINEPALSLPGITTEKEP